MSCPRSLITAESLAWIEEFHVWRLEGKSGLLKQEARKAEAFLLLEAELLKENRDGKQ